MGSAARFILESPGTYDIIIGDFGRRAAIRLLLFVEELERRILRLVLNDVGVPFYDEYRRISFSLVGDVRSLKDEIIRDAVLRRGELDDAVLIGVDGAPVPDLLLEKLVELCAYEAACAFDRGHRYVRVCFPCNTLSKAAKQVVNSLNSHSTLKRYLGSSGSFGMRELEAVTVVEANVRLLIEDGVDCGNGVIALGTRLTNETYVDVFERHGVRVLQLSEMQYAVIDDCVTASISGSEERLNKSREKLQRDVVGKLQERAPKALVLEACTDFEFRLGVNSLHNMARWMVRNTYRQLLLDLGRSDVLVKL